MSIVLDAIGSFLMHLLPERVGNGSRSDRRLLAEDKVRCGIRASEGRVLNIGTEWSTGSCEFGPGHLRFLPSMGIVGEREIEVISLRLMDGRPYEEVVAPWGESTYLVITTEAGDLDWVLPEHIADEVIARVSMLTE